MKIQETTRNMKCNFIHNRGETNKMKSNFICEMNKVLRLAYILSLGILLCSLTTYAVSPSEVTVQPPYATYQGYTLQQIVNNPDVKVVKFLSGETYTLNEVLEISKSVKLVSEPKNGTQPVINVNVSGPDLQASVVINGGSPCNVELENLNIQMEGCMWVLATDDLKISDCIIQSNNNHKWPALGTTMRGGTTSGVRGNASIRNSSLISKGDGTDTPVGMTIFDPQVTSSYVIKDSYFEGGIGLAVVWFGGTLTAIGNHFRNTGYHMGLSMGIFNASVSASLFFNQNTITMDVPYGSPIGCFGSGAVFENMTISGSNQLFMVWAWNLFGPVTDNTFKNIDRTNLTVVGGAEYMLQGATGNLIMDNAMPMARIVDTSDNWGTPEYDGDNILLGRLQHLYGAEGNAAIAKAEEMKQKIDAAVAERTHNKNAPALSSHSKLLTTWARIKAK